MSIPEAVLATIALLIFALIALTATTIGAVWLYNRSKRRPPPAGAVNTATSATGTRNSGLTSFFQMLVIAGVTYTLLFLFPWGSTPPGELTASLLSREAHEMLVWFLRAGVIVLALGAIWLIFNHSHAKYLKTAMGWIAFLAIIFLSAALVRGWAESDSSTTKETVLVDLRSWSHSETRIMEVYPSQKIRIIVPNVPYGSKFINCYRARSQGDGIIKEVESVQGIKTLRFLNQEKLAAEKQHIIVMFGRREIGSNNPCA